MPPRPTRGKVLRELALRKEARWDTREVEAKVAPAWIESRQPRAGAAPHGQRLRCELGGHSLATRRTGHVSTEKGREIRERAAPPHPASLGTARRTATLPRPGLIPGGRTLPPRPRRPLRSSGVAARAAPAWAARRGGSGPRIPGRRPGARGIALGARVCRWGLTAKGGGALAESGDSPKYTVLSHLGHLEAMVGAPCRLAPSARARLRVAAAAAPAPPTRLSESPLVSRPGRGVEIPSPGSRSREWGSRPGGGAPVRRAGDSRTCLAPLGLAREVASAVARPRLACFHGNVGAAGRGVRGPFGWGESWPAGPRPGRAAPGHTNECPEGGPARHSRLWRPGSPREDPTPTLPRSPLPFVAWFL